MIVEILIAIAAAGFVESIHFLDRTIIKPRLELKSIRAAYVIVEKGVITNRRGEIFPLSDKEKIEPSVSSTFKCRIKAA
jgi:hypothetical protein